MTTTYFMSPAEIDAIVAALRAEAGDHVARGKIGDGYACRDGVFFSLWVEEELSGEGPFADEAAFRSHLGELDLNDARNNYRRVVFVRLGAVAYDAGLSLRRR